jgi:hypothetical protein
VYYATGRYEQWLAESRKTFTLFNDSDELAIFEEMSRVYSKSGLKPALVRQAEMTEALAKKRYGDPAFIGYAYAELGDKDKTFFWLNKAVAEKAGGLEAIKVTADMDAFRSDPRYLDILKRMGSTP